MYVYTHAGKPMFNGAIAALREGVLCPVDDLSTAEMLLVVSDDNAKWKGEPYPTPEQEKSGHWCAYLGQVPLRVKGAVKAGQYLGPIAGVLLFLCAFFESCFWYCLVLVLNGRVRA